MHNLTIILLGLGMFAYARTRSPGKPMLSRFQHLKGWQKIFGVLAVILTILIFLNPEFLALGLIGDTAFLDMLVLALSLQLHQSFFRGFRRCLEVLTRTARWLGTPSPGLRYIMAVLTPAIATAVTAVQKIVHRFLS